MITVTTSILPLLLLLLRDHRTATTEAFALLMPKSTFHVPGCGVGHNTVMGAKPKRKPSPDDVIVSSSVNHGDDALPQQPQTKDDDPIAALNLRRKVEAKRPPLGHIVPQAVKVIGTGGSANPRLRPQGKAREAGMNNPSMLRIAGGVAKGRRLDSPSVYLRPMMGKVREAVYSTFTSFGLYEFDTTRHLDIFAGSGSVGLESLSRGACHCTFVDLSPDCCAAIERNAKWCQFTPEQVQVVTADAIQALRQPTTVGIPAQQTYQIITVCPPYEEVVYGDLLDALVSSPLVTEDTVVLVEYPVELGTLPHAIPGNNGSALVGMRNRRYGRTVIAIYVFNPTGKLNNAAQSRPEEFVSMK